MKHRNFIAKSLAILAAASFFTAAAPLPAIEGLSPAPVVEAAAPWVDESLRPLPLSVTAFDVAVGDAGGVDLHQRWPRISLADDARLFPELAAALKKYSEDETRVSEDIRRVTVQSRRTTHPPYPHRWRTELFLRRADTLAVSFLESTLSDEGDGYGRYILRGKNYDTRTGRELSLSDVCPDPGGLAGAIDAQLRRDYPEAPFLADGGQKIAWIVESMARANALQWTLDPAGASFYFDRAELDGETTGLFTATVLFDERPELFRDEYRRAPQSYCLELRPWLPVRTLFADGSGAAVQIQQTASSDEKLTVFCGGGRYTEPGAARDVRAMLVSLADGRRYIYADILSGERNFITYVYDLNGNAPAPVPTARAMTRCAALRPPQPGIYGEETFYAMTDPEDFLMVYVGGPGGNTAIHRCRVGADGAPEEKR